MDGFKKKKTELFESYKYPIAVRLLKNFTYMTVHSRFRQDYKACFDLDSTDYSKLSLTRLIEIYGKDLEKYETEIVRDGVFINEENPSNAPFLVVREKIQLNKRVFYVDFHIEDDTEYDIPTYYFGTLGTDFFVQNKAIIDYESKRLWVDDYKAML